MSYPPKSKDHDVRMGEAGKHISTILDHKPVTAPCLKQTLLLLKKGLTFFRSHVQIL